MTANAGTGPAREPLDLPVDAPIDVGDIYRSLDLDDHSEAVSVLLKVRGDTCDIDCLYCYEKRKATPSAARMDAGDVASITRLFRGRPVAVELHGGEPLTAGQDHIAEVLDELATAPNVIRVSLQTNGVRLTNSWLDLFDEHYPELELGISLDGDPTGNAWRVGYDGRPTHKRVEAALDLLAARGRQVGLISVVTPRVLGRANEVLTYLSQSDAVRAVSFVPCFDATVTTPVPSIGSSSPQAAARGRSETVSRRLQRNAVNPTGGPTWATTPDEYADFILETASHWISTGLFAQLSLEPVVAVIRRLQGLGVRSCHFSDLKCHHILTLYPDGRLGSCDELPWPQAQLATLGSVTTPAHIAGTQAASPLLSAGKSLMAKCVGCRYRSTCGGGCVATRLRESAAAGSDDAYCTHRMRLIDGVAALVAAPHDLAGARCRRIRWQPRTPNSMRDVTAFVARWDDPTSPRLPARIRLSPTGNINVDGVPGGVEADDLDPHHPDWQRGIEPGVWPLIDAFTTRWQSITYDSCEGHPNEGSPPGPMRVGLLPRTPDDAAQLAGRLCRLTNAAEARLPAGCLVTIGRSLLMSDASGRQHPALDLHLEPAFDMTWDEWAALRNNAVATLTSLVFEIAARGTPRSCACTDANDIDVNARPPDPARTMEA
ncbi:MAG: radical SAM protein [Dermatophilaceae bacterium]